MLNGLNECVIYMTNLNGNSFIYFLQFTKLQLSQLLKQNNFRINHIKILFLGTEYWFS